MTHLRCTEIYISINHNQKIMEQMVQNERLDDETELGTNTNLDTGLTSGSENPETSHVTHNELNDSQIKAEEEE